jgi:Protein of unknown function (DUF1800)
MKRISVFILVLFFSVLVATNFSYAATKPPKGSKKLPADKIFTYEDGKIKFVCGQIKGWEPGTMAGKKKAYFWPLRSQVSVLKKAPKTKSNQSKLKKLQKKYKDGKKACAGGPPDSQGTPTPGPTVTPEPQFVEYTAALTADDVKYMFSKVAYAATDEDIAACTGQTAAWCFDNRINKFDEVEHDRLMLEASKYLDGDPNQGDYYGLVNGSGQINLQGLQMASAYMMLNSSSQYHTRLVFQQLHHHYAFVYGTLGNDMVRQRGAWTFFKTLFSLAKGGSFTGTFRRMTSDPVLQIFLDNASNTKFAPGENFPREVWELYGIGKADPDGNANYDNVTDIPQFSKAFTGWVAQNFYDPSTSRNELTITFVTGNHAEGEKIVFLGQPHQKTISSLSDAVDATIAHPTFGYHQAQLLAKMYLANDPTKEELLELAQEATASDSMHAVMRKMATSTLFFGKYKAAVMKDGLSMVVGPAKQLTKLGFTVTPQTLQSIMVNASHEIGNSPQGPFGWIPYNRWAGLRMSTVNAVNQLLIAGQPQVNGQNYNYCGLLSGIPAASVADKATVINYFANLFGVALNDAQRAELIQYMDRTPNQFDAQGVPTRFTTAVWTGANAGQCRTKIIGLSKILLSMVQNAAH